jgi:hypothetical protein
MRYEVSVDDEDGFAHIIRSGDGEVIGRGLTKRDAERICEELNSAGAAAAVLRDRLLDAVTDAIEEAFE